jgi:hypothetical protein
MFDIRSPGGGACRSMSMGTRQPIHTMISLPQLDGEEMPTMLAANPAEIAAWGCMQVNMIHLMSCFPLSKAVMSCVARIVLQHVVPLLLSAVQPCRVLVFSVVMSSVPTLGLQ